MKNPLFTSAFLTAILLLLFCDIPPDPAENPDNSSVKVFIEDDPQKIPFGSVQKTGAAIKLPVHIEKVRIWTGGGDLDSTLPCTSSVFRDTIFLEHRFVTEGVTTIYASAAFHDKNHDNIIDSIIIVVLPEPVTIEFDTFPAVYLTQTGKTDTLKFSIKTNSRISPEFRVSAVPEPDSTLLRIYQSQKTAEVLFASDKPGIFLIKVYAQIDSVRDSAEVEVTIYEKIAVLSVIPDTFWTDKPDTILFTKSSGRKDTFDINLLNKEDFAIDELTVLKNKPDSLSLKFIPVSSGSNRQISLFVTNRHIGDTLRFNLHINKSDTFYNVIYNGNDNDTGMVPVDAGNYKKDSTITILDKGSLAREGFSFYGWNTRQDGTGILYLPQSTVSMPGSDLILFAQWKALPAFRVKYDKNGADTGTVPIDSNSFYNGKEVTVAGNPGNLYRDGYSFSGWNTKADGSSITYNAGSKFAMPDSAVTLYVKWTTKPTYSIIYHGSTSTGGNVPETVNADSGMQVTIADSGSLYKTGYAFEGWNIKEDGSGKAYKTGDKIVMDTVDIDLYAQWMKEQFTISGLSLITIKEADSVIREIVVTGSDQAVPELTITGSTPAWVTYTVLSNSSIRLSIKPGYDAVQSGTQVTFKLYFKATSGLITKNDSLSVIVTNVNQKPTLSLNLTKTIDTISAGTSLTLTVTADDIDGTISNIVLFHNGSPLTNNSYPYQFSISSISYGIHRFSALAIDNNNDTSRTNEYTIKAGRWLEKVEAQNSYNYQYQFDRDGIPVRSSIDSYSDMHRFNFSRFNPVSGGWDALGNLSVNISEINNYWSNDNSIRYTFAFNNNNSLVVLLSLAKNNYDTNGDYVSYDKNFLVYQLSGGIWSKVGSIVRKTDLYPMLSISETNITISSEGIIAFCLNEIDQRSNVGSTSYILSGNSWSPVSNPIDYTDITYLNNTLYSHCGIYYYYPPNKSSVKVHSLSLTSTWNSVGESNGTVVLTGSQHNKMVIDNNGTIYISVPDTGVFTYSNSSWRKLWPFTDAEIGISELSVNIIDNAPYITYVKEMGGGSNYSLFCKKIQNGAADGILGDSGFICDWSTAHNQLYCLSAKKILLFNNGTNWIIYRLDIPN